MSISSERQTWEACLRVQPGIWRVCHSLATARKVGVDESPACFSAWRTRFSASANARQASAAREALARGDAPASRVRLHEQEFDPMLAADLAGVVAAILVAYLFWG